MGASNKQTTMRSSVISLTLLVSLGSVILSTKDEERQFDLSTLLGLAGVGGGGAAGLGGLANLGADGASGLLSNGGKGGKGALSLFGGRSLATQQLNRHGKGKDGKGKGNDGKGKGKDGKKGKGEGSSASPLLNLLSNNLLGQIIQSVLNLLTGAVSSVLPLRTALEPKA